MTREEAIKWFRESPFYHKNHVPFNMAIKALEQEPKSEWEQDHAILKAYSDGTEDILEKIRAEIKKAVWEDSIYSRDGADEVRIPRLDPDDVFEIIDKYKAGSEG